MPAEYGGLGLPSTLNAVMQEFVSSANLALGMYPGLTQGAIAALLVHGSDDQKADLSAQDDLGRMVGHDEPDRSRIAAPISASSRTKAAKQADGSYRITGQKIFISAGEHDLTSNIVHLVLAADRGRAGRHQGHLALRLPENLVEADGSLGARNAARLRQDRGEDGHPRQFDLRHEL